MGVVYKAQDIKLDRIVALKFLPKQFLCDSEAKTRFEHEAKAASALDHPNICNIHEIDEIEGECFISMAYVEGKSIKELLKVKTFSLNEVLDIGIQICGGLATAHEKGIVHRDIKSDNIMLTPRGQVKIMDFGLAKLRGVSKVTKTGSTLGTVAYMSPEQARGEEVDTRTDIWSFGIVMYEMITGQLPFKGEYEQAVVYAILNEEPRPLVESRPEISPELEQIVNRALAKRQDSRYEKAEDILVDLDKLRNKLVSSKEQASTAKAQPSIAVLPFANLSADKENEYFSDGLAEDIIDALTQVPGLRVMARTSAFAFRGKEADVREIGARLNVEHILEGSVRKAGSRIRVTAQLVKASDGYHLWSQRFDREMTDVFAIQDEISQAIVEKLRGRLLGERPLVKRYTENPAAYDLCLKARYHLLKMTQEGREAGRRYCEQAIALDSNYALAYVVLCESYLWNLYWGSTDPRESYPRAKAAALEALRLDETIADAHSALGTVLGSGEFDWPGAEREFCRALELSPSSAVIRYDYAWCYAMWFLLPLGRVEEALAEMRRALELDPLDPFYNTLVGYLLHCTRQFEPAVAQLQRAIDLDPTFFFSYWLFSTVLDVAGRLDEAVAAAEKANELSGGTPSTLGTLGRAYGMAGRTAEARQLLEELTARRRLTYVPASALASVHRGLGGRDEARSWVERGIEERDPILVTSVKSAPILDPLKSHPAYKAMLRKMNLEP